MPSGKTRRYWAHLSAAADVADEFAEEKLKVKSERISPVETSSAHAPTPLLEGVEKQGDTSATPGDCSGVDDVIEVVLREGIVSLSSVCTQKKLQQIKAWFLCRFVFCKLNASHVLQDQRHFRSLTGDRHLL